MTETQHPLMAEIAHLTAVEQRIIDRFIHRQRVARDITQAQMSFGDRVADRVASFGGSWPFIFLFGTVMFVWMGINIAGLTHFDLYPFILLNLCLSTLAAIQAPIIMMSQNRQATKDKLLAENDYQVNRKAEMEVAAVLRNQAEVLAKLDVAWLHDLDPRLFANANDPATYRTLLDALP